MRPSYYETTSNSGSTGLVLTPQDIADLYQKIPAICAIKNAIGQPRHSMDLHRLAPRMVICEMDAWAAAGMGLIKHGYAAPLMMANICYQFEIPGKMIYTRFWQLVQEGKDAEAVDYYHASGLADIAAAQKVVALCPYRPGYSGHWCAGMKYEASLLGLPIGDYPHSRPPLTRFPDELKKGLRDTYEKLGFIGGALSSSTLRGAAGVTIGSGSR